LINPNKLSLVRRALSGAVNNSKVNGAVTINGVG
jgi:hypothetical protein